MTQSRQFKSSTLNFKRTRGMKQTIFATLALLLTSGCGLDADSQRIPEQDGEAKQDDFEPSQGDEGTAGGDSENSQESEVEGAGSIHSPVVSGSYVFHRSEKASRVSAMHGQSLKITNAQVGYPPIAMTAVPNPPPGGARVGVLGRGEQSSEIALVELDAAGKASVAVYPVARSANQILADSKGRYLFAYHNVNTKVPAVPGSDQELSILDLQSKAVVNLSVGAHPREIVFSPDNTKAFVLSADGVSVVSLANLGQGGKQPLIPVAPRLGLDPDRIEIKVEPKLGQAVARANSLNRFWVTDLSNGRMREFELSAPATDLDLQAGRAMLLIPGKEDSSLVELVLPANDTSEPSVIKLGGAYVGVGEYSQDGQSALFYTTRDKASSKPEREKLKLARRQLTFARRGNGDWADQQKLFVDAPIRQIGIAPNQKSAVLLHSEAAQLNPQAPYAYSILDLSAQFPIKKLQHVVSPLNSLLFTPKGDRAALTSRAPDGSQSSVEIVSLDSFVVASHPLPSMAVELGYVESVDSIFVSQAHSLGRVTLLSPSGEIRTVTGFAREDSVKVDP